MNRDTETAEAYAVAPEIMYAVWIPGVGWLKRDDADAQTTFVSYTREVAQTAAALWGGGARVLPFDGSLLELESRFRAREQAARGLKAWLHKHGILV